MSTRSARRDDSSRKTKSSATKSSETNSPHTTNSSGSAQGSRLLPEHPNLRHLKDQAKDLLRAGGARNLADAQLQIARSYAFASWPKLNAHVESLEQIGQLKLAIDANDFGAVRSLMTKNPALHAAPMGYGKNGPLTWVAECRVPWEAPSAARLAIAEWMIEHGSDVHQGGDGPLMRAALVGERIPMMELLVAHGADVNALWNGYYPIIFAPCETLEPRSLDWLLAHGANANCAGVSQKYPGTALDFVMGTYSRSENLPNCIEVLVEAGTTTQYNEPAVLAILRNRLDLLRELLDSEPGLVNRRFRELNIGNTGMRRLALRGATLLHVAAEYGNREVTALLLERGADVNAAAAMDADGVGGQTAIFHAASQFYDWGLAVTQLLIERGADLAVRVTLPGQYDRPEEFVTATAFGYALRFPGTQAKTIALLRQHQAPE
jgi:ankyrin repeat protein